MEALYRCVECQWCCCSADRRDGAAGAAAANRCRRRRLPTERACCVHELAARARCPHRPPCFTLHCCAALTLPCRYRGVGAIVAVPLLLILTVLLVMPRGSPFPAHDFSRAQPFSRTHYEGPHGGGAANGSKAAARGGGGAADDGARYAIVVDAGSTGSRVHIFKFLPSAAGGGLDLQYDKFDQLKPGLSAFADDPPAAAASLAPLLDLAEATIPPAQHAATSIQVGATAGLRLLPDGKADDILAEVRAWLRGKPFKVRAHQGGWHGWRHEVHETKGLRAAARGCYRHALQRLRRALRCRQLDAVSAAAMPCSVAAVGVHLLARLLTRPPAPPCPCPAPPPSSSRTTTSRS